MTSRRFRVLLITASLVVLIAIGYALTGAPVHVASLRAESSAGQTSLRLSVPDETYDFYADLEADWSVEPLVPELAGFPILRDPGVLLGAQRGALLRSPDHGLVIGVSSSEVPSDDQSSMKEELASGAAIHHIRRDSELAIVWRQAETALTIEIELTDAAGHRGLTLDDYYPAISTLLESIDLQERQ